VKFPKVKCPHCGNRSRFDIEITARVALIAGGPGSPYVKDEELPFNSRIWCHDCGRQGRWNAWQRGADEP
jgi:hypothetical protein